MPIFVHACPWVFSPVYWTFVGHELWRAELPTPGLRPEKAEAASPAVGSRTSGWSSLLCILPTAGSQAASGDRRSPAHRVRGITSEPKPTSSRSEDSPTTFATLTELPSLTLQRRKSRVAH